MAKTKADFEGNTFAADPVSEVVEVRVLKRGDGKISTGVHDAQGGDVLFETDETFKVAKHIADELEDRGFVEIQAHRAKAAG